ncbi:TraG/TraD/VirD4 family protein [Streptococcus suis]
MMGNYHARCGAGEKPEVVTPEAYLSLFGLIPRFEKLIATIRSREISAAIILQAKSQLKAIYKDNADTIIGNCDTELFLGGKEGTTLKELAENLGKETIELYNTSETRSNQKSFGLNYQKLGKELMSRDELKVMDGGKCILEIRGTRPFYSDKYDITKHKHYKLLEDFDKRNKFDIEAYLKNRGQAKLSENTRIIQL